MLNYRMNCYWRDAESNGSFVTEEESLISFDDGEFNREELLTSVFGDSAIGTEAMQFSNKIFFS